MVASITGIRQRETVPDEVVRAADTIELVDMSPQALRRRMAHGNVYAADKIDAALANYFREGNLGALRELALLWLADRVDAGLERYRGQHRIAGSWPTRERVVVGVSGGPESLALMRRAARIASRTAGGEWLAVYVSRRDGLTGVAPDALERLRVAAEEMGGGFQAVVAHDSADGLLDVARGVNASQVLIGASRRGRLSTRAAARRGRGGDRPLRRDRRARGHPRLRPPRRPSPDPPADAEPGPPGHRLPGGGARHGAAGAGPRT